jgi:hypothetical protein
MLRWVLLIAFLISVIFLTAFIFLHILLAVSVGLIFFFSFLKLKVELNKNRRELIWRISSPLNVAYKTQKYRNINGISLSKREFIHDPAYRNSDPPTHYDFYILITTNNGKQGQFFLKTVRLEDKQFMGDLWDKNLVLQEGHRISDSVETEFINNVNNWS